MRARAGLNFLPAQRWAILKTIAAHEAPGTRQADAPLLHRVRLPAGAGRVRVLLALLVWQLLNHTDALAAQVVEFEDEVGVGGSGHGVLLG